MTSGELETLREQLVTQLREQQTAAVETQGALKLLAFLQASDGEAPAPPPPAKD